MAESDIKDADQPPVEADVVADAPGLETVIIDAMQAGDSGRVHDLIADLHYADFADLLERLGRDDREKLIFIIRDIFDPEVLSELDETVREHVLEVLGLKRAANAISELDSDDALMVLEEMDEDRQKELLDHISDTERTFIEEGLSYPEDSAGRLMQREVVTVPSQWNVGQCIDYIRRHVQTQKLIPWQILFV